MNASRPIPAVSVTCARTGLSAQTEELGMRPMQTRAFARRGEQYLLIKSPPASGKSRALMFIALDKLANQGVTQAIIVVPEKNNRDHVDIIIALGMAKEGSDCIWCEHALTVGYGRGRLPASAHALR